MTGSFDQRVQIFNTASDCRSAASCPAFLGKFGTRVNPAPNATGFDYPKAMEYFDGKLWIGENDGNDIQVYNPDGTWVHRFGQQGSALGQFKIGVMGLASPTSAAPTTCLRPTSATAGCRCGRSRRCSARRPARRSTRWGAAAAASAR